MLTERTRAVESFRKSPLRCVELSFPRADVVRSGVPQNVLIRIGFLDITTVRSDDNRQLTLVVGRFIVLSEFRNEYDVGSWTTESCIWLDEHDRDCREGQVGFFGVLDVCKIGC